MDGVGKIVAAHGCVFDLITSKPLRVGATAIVSTGGYSDAALSPAVYIDRPADGIWDFTFTATKPAGLVIQVETVIGAIIDVAAPDWLRGIRVHGATNQLEGEVITLLGASPADVTNPSS